MTKYFKIIKMNQNTLLLIVCERKIYYLNKTIYLLYFILDT